MADVAELQLQLAALKKARSSGALIVKHGDTQVTYRSIEELQKAIDIITGEINQANGVSRKPVYIKQRTKAL